MKKKTLGSKIVEFLAINIIPNLAANIMTAFILSALAVAFAWVKRSTLEQTLSYIALICSLLSLFISVFYLIRNKKPERSIEPKFKAKSINAEFFFSSREDMESRLEYDMELTCPNMEKYHRDLLWSGSDYYGTEIAPEFKNDYAIDEDIRAQSPHDYTIQFKSLKRLGDSVHFKTITRVGDTKHIMKCFYSFTALFQIEVLTLRITAPVGLIKNVKRAVYADRSRSLEVESGINIPAKTYGNNDVYEVNFDNPTLLYNYFIEWEFTNP